MAAGYRHVRAQIAIPGLATYGASGKKGDDLKISWVDNKGATDTTTAKIQ